MIKLNIHEAKTHLSKYLVQLEKGATILLCRRNVPIAKIVPVLKTEQKNRPVGLAKGEFRVPDTFFEPLPDELIKAFSGEND